MLFLLRLLALALFIYSVSLVFTSNFNMGNLLVWLLTAAVDVYAIWQQPIHHWLHGTIPGKIVFVFLLVFGILYAALLGFVAFSGYANPATGQEKVVIVPDALVITTGGQGRDEWVPEGQAMRNYLIEKGLDSQRVLAECKSTSTEENFLFAKAILVQQGISAQEPVVYVTNAFHCYRGGVYAAMAGFTTAHALPAGIPLRSVLTCYLREAAAVIYYWLFKSSRTGFMQPLVGLLSLNKKFFYK